MSAVQVCQGLFCLLHRASLSVIPNCQRIFTVSMAMARCFPSVFDSFGPSEASRSLCSLRLPYVIWCDKRQQTSTNSSNVPSSHPRSPVFFIHFQVATLDATSNQVLANMIRCPCDHLVPWSPIQVDTGHASCRGFPSKSGTTT